MDEHEIKRIFFKNLILDDIGNSLIKSRQEVTKKILLDLLSGLSVNHEQWELTIKINYTLSHIDYFFSLQDNTHTESSENFFYKLGFLYETCEECLMYAYRNYELPNFDVVREKITKDTFFKNANSVEAKLTNIKNEITNTGKVRIKLDELTNIKKTLELFLSIILGQDSFQKLTEIINPALVILAMLAQEIQINESSVIH